MDWWGFAAPQAWPCCCWLCRGTWRGMGRWQGSGTAEGTCQAPLEVQWVSPTFPPLSYLSSLLSLELLRELVGAGESLVPVEALLGVARNGTVGMTPEMGQAGQGAGTGGRTSGTSISMRVIRSQQESPQGRICSSQGISQCCGRIRAPSHFSPPPWSEHPQTGP